MVSLKRILFFYIKYRDMCFAGARHIGPICKFIYIRFWVPLIFTSMEYIINKIIYA